MTEVLLWKVRVITESLAFLGEFGWGDWGFRVSRSVRYIR